MKLHIHCTISVFLCLYATSAFADLNASATAETQPANGQTRYVYTVTNHARSTVPVDTFELEIPADANLTDIKAPAGWTGHYTVKNTSVNWTEPKSGGLKPGQKGIFSFVSPLPVGNQEFNITGVKADNAKEDDTSSDEPPDSVNTTGGSITAPKGDITQILVHPLSDGRKVKLVNNITYFNATPAPDGTYELNDGSTFEVYSGHASLQSGSWDMQK